MIERTFRELLWYHHKAMLNNHSRVYTCNFYFSQPYTLIVSSSPSCLALASTTKKLILYSLRSRISFFQKWTPLEALNQAQSIRESIKFIGTWKKKKKIIQTLSMKSIARLVWHMLVRHHYALDIGVLQTSTYLDDK